MAEAKIVSRRALPLVVVVVGSFTRVAEEVDEAEAEAEAKRVAMVTLPLLGDGAGEADGMSFENNLSKSDTVPLVALVGG